MLLLGLRARKGFCGALVTWPVGRAGTAKEFTESGAMHEVKEAFLKATRERGDADFEKQKSAAPPDRQPPPAQRLKLQTDAVLDGLISKLEPQR